MVNGKTYELIKLLGHGKGGYSYLALCDGFQVVLKQIHHEPCDYYSFGDKFQSELFDYQRLKDANIKIPELIDHDKEKEIIIKEYIEGKTIFEMIEEGLSVNEYLPQVRIMAEQAKEKNLNIDYFPTNFVVKDELLYYIDYECNEYMEEWSFDKWGIKYWSYTREFEYHLKEKNQRSTI